MKKFATIVHVFDTWVVLHCNKIKREIDMWCGENLLNFLLSEATFCSRVYCFA